MEKRDELILTDILENPEEPLRELLNTSTTTALRVLTDARWWSQNPYWIPYLELWWIANIRELVSYLSAIFNSVWNSAPQKLTGWLQIWIENTLYRILSSNGNALEWYLLQCLIQTRLWERSSFERPPFEIDQAFATDIIWSPHAWLMNGKKTIGLQITSIRPENRRFPDKQNRVQQVWVMLQEENVQKKLRKFGYKRPDVLALVWVYGGVGKFAHNQPEYAEAFCLDFWLPLNKSRKPFADEIYQESLDIANFIRSILTLWDKTITNKKDRNFDSSIIWRQGEYTISGRYSVAEKKSSFSLLKEQLLFCFIEFFDTKNQK